MARQHEIKAKDRIRKCLPRYAAVLSQAMQRGISEEDTSTIAQSILVDVLGYDRFADITGQFAVRGKWADWAVRSGDALHFLVEVKSLGGRLRERDLFQVVSYSRQHNLEWAVLTTGDIWQCHRVPGGEDPEQFFEVRLLDAGQSDDEKVEHMYLLSKEGFGRGAIQEQWARAECFRPLSLARILLSDEVTTAVRRALGRENPGRRIDVADVRAALTRSVIRGDLYTSLQTEQPGTSPQRANGTGPKRSVLKSPIPPTPRAPLVGQRTQEPSVETGAPSPEPWKVDGRAWHMQRLSEPVWLALERLVGVLGDHVVATVWEQAHYVWLRGRGRNLRVHTALKGRLEIGLHPATEDEATAFLRGYSELGLTPKAQAGYKSSPFIRPPLGPAFPEPRLVAMLVHWLDGENAAPYEDR